MKNKIILSITLFSCVIFASFGQFSTGNRTLPGAGTIQIDTSPTIVTMTLTLPSDRWMGIGFAATTMATVTDMFIWNDTPNRDYTPNTVGNLGHNLPSPDASQSWTIVSDNVVSGTRTVVATRALVSAGDYTFTNNPSGIQIIYALGDTTTLAYHGANPHSTIAMSRFMLGTEDFSLKASSIYPNPSTGTFIIKTKTTLEKITIYSQSGGLVKTIQLDGKKEENEINVSDLAAGTYLFELQNGEDKAWKRVVIE